MKRDLKERGWDQHGLGWSFSPGCGDEPTGFIKCGEFLDYMRTD